MNYLPFLKHTCKFTSILFIFVKYCFLTWTPISGSCSCVSLKLYYLLSPDIKTRSGPGDSFYTFCNWDINTLNKHDFQRNTLLEARNYDNIFLCETSSNEDTQVPENFLGGFRISHRTTQVVINDGELVFFIRKPYQIRENLSFEVYSYQTFQVSRITENNY